jgi:hypothetical protein
MDSDFLPSSEKVISDPDTAKLLVDPRVRHHLAPFVGQARNVSEVASFLGTSTHALMYWVKKFLEHGLLELNRSEARPGRAIKYYQASSAKFLIPFKALPAETLEGLLSNYDAHWQARLTKNMLRVSQDTYTALHTWLMVVEEDTRGGLCVNVSAGAKDDRSLRQRLLEPEAPALLTNWTPLNLSFEEAKRFQRELSELIDRYRECKGPQRYLARLALTPIVED